MRKVLLVVPEACVSCRSLTLSACMLAALLISTKHTSTAEAGANVISFVVFDLFFKKKTNLNLLKLNWIHKVVFLDESVLEKKKSHC